MSLNQLTLSIINPLLCKMNNHRHVTSMHVCLRAYTQEIELFKYKLDCAHVQLVFMLATFVWYTAQSVILLLTHLAAHEQPDSQQPDLCATSRRVCKPHLPGHIVSWDVLLMLVLTAVRLCGHHDLAQLCKSSKMAHFVFKCNKEDYLSLCYQGLIILQLVCVSHMGNIDACYLTLQSVILLRSHLAWAWAGYFMTTGSLHYHQTCFQTRGPWSDCELRCATDACVIMMLLSCTAHFKYMCVYHIMSR